MLICHCEGHAGSKQGGIGGEFKPVQVWPCWGRTGQGSPCSA